MHRVWITASFILMAGGLLHAQPAAGGDSSAPAALIDEKVARQLAMTPEARVVILLDVAGFDRRAIEPYRAEVARLQERFLSALGKGDLKLRHRLQSVPIISGDLRSSGLARLRHMAGVLRVDLEQEGGGDLAQSVPLIRADVVQSLGYTGAGMTVAVIDSGIDSDHPDLADAVEPGEACFCSGGCCPAGGSTQFGPGAAEDEFGHGTAVSGVVASNGLVSPRGIAPDAKIVSVRVVDRNDHTCCMSDVLAGLDWVLVNRPDVDAVNISVTTSVGGNNYPGDCDNVDGTTLGFARVLGDLRARGVLTFMAAGNTANGGGMGMPACVSNAVSVGAVWDANAGGGWNFGVCIEAATAADQVACFTNSDSVTDLFAPGALITTDWMGGVAAGTVGTSFAAPHGAGCAALLRQATPGLSAAALEARLKATGTPVTDPKNGLTFPRIDCLAALQIRSCTDADGDGFWVPGGAGCPAGPYADCDDADATRFPGNTETCDGQDNNCNGLIDEGFDPDGDGLASCFDNCPIVANPGQTDLDDDGEGDACDLNDGYIDVRLDDTQSIRWQQEQAWPLFNVYRGNLGELTDTDHDGAAESYGTCLAEDLPGPSFVDAAMPAVGQGFIYLIRGKSAGVEGPLGDASSGAPRLNVRTCAQVFGVPPSIESVELIMSEDQVACDFTTICETWVCGFGYPGIQAISPIAVGGSYTHLEIHAHVIDADSTAEVSDIVNVSAVLVLDTGEMPVALADDGSLSPIPTPQRSAVGQDCSGSGSGCVCQSQTYLLRTGDALASDSIYTQGLALVPPGLPILEQDCIMRQAATLPVSVASGTTVRVRVTATDRAGHQVTWPDSTAGVVAPGSYACTGDACGCCLMTSADPISQCQGLPGMISPDVPAGLCLSF
jgi:Subtilase family/Putative metal-binding motif